MSKRRIDPNRAREIAEERMTVLLRLSCEAAVRGDADRARRYVDLARRIGMKTRTGMPRDVRYCKACRMPLVPGVSCTVRLRNHRIGMRCAQCGSSRRISYIREQKDD